MPSITRSDTAPAVSTIEKTIRSPSYKRTYCATTRTPTEQMLAALRAAKMADELGRMIYLDWDFLNERQKDVRCGRILRTAADWIERNVK